MDRIRNTDQDIGTYRRRRSGVDVGVGVGGDLPVVCSPCCAGVNGLLKKVRYKPVCLFPGSPAVDL